MPIASPCLLNRRNITIAFAALILTACGDANIDGAAQDSTEEVSQAAGGDQVDETSLDEDLIDETHTLDEPSLPTWAACRQMSLDESLDSSTKTICDDLYLSAPLERLYGIRFIMISHPTNEEEWLD